MNQVLKTILYVVVLTFLYLWMVTMFNSCKNTPTVEEVVENVGDSADDVAEYFEDDESAGGRTIDLSEDGSLDDDSTDEEFDEPAPRTDFTDLESEAVETAPTTSTSSNYTPPPRSNSSGRHLVVAGNFSVEVNANQMVSKLSNMGYSAQKVIFDNSRYHTVLAYRGDNYNQAVQVSGELDRNGIDNYITTPK